MLCYDGLNATLTMFVDFHHGHDAEIAGYRLAACGIEQREARMDWLTLL